MTAHNLIDIVYVRVHHGIGFQPVRAWFDNQATLIVKEIAARPQVTTGTEAFIAAREWAKKEGILFIDVYGLERQLSKSKKTVDQKEHTEKVALLATRVAALYADINTIGPCACIGGDECRNFGCPRVWEYIIANPSDIGKALNLYEVVEGIVCR